MYSQPSKQTHEPCLAQEHSCWQSWCILEPGGVDQATLQVLWVKVKGLQSLWIEIRKRHA